MEQLSLVLLTAVMHDNLQRLDPFFVSGNLGADRPIAAEHDALRPEDIERVVDERCQIVRRPGTRPGGHDDARDLADDLLPFGNRHHVALPLGMILGLDVAVAAMIQDEARVWAGIDELGGVSQFSRPHTNIEAHAELAQEPDAFDEIGAQAIAGWHFRVVQYLAHPLDVTAALERLQIRLET